MKSLQDLIIEKYRQVYPQDTLRDISNKTKIQHTRVFRIFNGSEMKISEYETFEELLSINKQNQHFQQLARECSRQLSTQTLNELYTQMKQTLKLAQLAQSISFNNYQQIELA